MICPLCVLLVSLIQPPSDPISLEVSRLSGSWQVVTAQADGKEMTERLKGFRYVFDGQLMKLLDRQGRPMLRSDNKPDERPFLINVQTNPRTMDITIQVKTKAFLSLGIYRLADEELTLCFAEPGAARPSDFKSKAGVTLVVLRKVK
ncbi:MAG TPA: TIGR03067 domain-containing protein [Gemmatales bacterium]|nr:TIGR03067 domain-containing protein [Gemmatales bacterium]